MQDRVGRRAQKRREGRDGDKWARLEPYAGFKLSLSIVFNHPVIDRASQAVTVDFAHTSYLKEIARARTFGFMHEVENLRESGLALGGGLDNAVVLDEYRVLNTEGLRFADEFIRHKVLDAIGDLYLAGKPLLAAFAAHKSGHALNNRLLRDLLADAAAWELVSFERPEDAPAAASIRSSRMNRSSLTLSLSVGSTTCGTRRSASRGGWRRRRGGRARRRRAARRS